MCKYCERQSGYGWKQPPISGVRDNITQGFKGVIHDYQTTSPQLILSAHTPQGFLNIYVDIDYCPKCGRKLGKNSA